MSLNNIYILKIVGEGFLFVLSDFHLNGKGVRVIALESLKGRKPDVAFSVLTDGKNSVLRQTVIY